MATRNDVGPAAAGGAAKLAQRLEDGAIGCEAHLAGGWGLVVRRLRSGAVAQGNDCDSADDNRSDYRNRRINSHVGRNFQNRWETSSRRGLRRFLVAQSAMFGECRGSAVHSRAASAYSRASGL